MRNISNKRKVKWLKKNCAGYGYGNLGNGMVVDLSNLDFGNMLLDFSGVKAKVINNSKQEANRIINSEMKSQIISNGYQVASEFIFNHSQQAGASILNVHQVIENRLICKTKEELIEIIEKLKE